MVRQRVLLFEQLKVVEAMRAFVSHRLVGGKELHARLKRVETDLAIAQKAAAEGVQALKLANGERKTICAKMDKLKKEGEAAEAKLKGSKQENSQLKREVEKLRVGFATQKKEIDELQAGFASQKNELEVGFVAQKKELEAEYQKQVDEMYFFGYRYCMKKNDIMHDISSIPSDDQDKIPRGPPR